jgi:hypothetical protein
MKKTQKYTDEQRAVFLQTLCDNIGKRGNPEWAISLKKIEEQLPGVLGGKNQSTQTNYLRWFWRINNPLKSRQVDMTKAIKSLNENLDRKSLIEMLKVKAQEFFLSGEYDNLKPVDKARLVSEAIKMDADEEKIEIQKAKQAANKRMMDSLAAALMSGDQDAILDKYKIEVSPNEETITLIGEKPNVQPNIVRVTPLPPPSTEAVIEIIGSGAE